MHTSRFRRSAAWAAVPLMFLVGCIIGLSATGASAAASGSWGFYGPVSGYSYKTQSSIEPGTSFLRFWTTVARNGSGTIPAGYMGVRAREFRESNDALITQFSDFLYTNSAVTSYAPKMVNDEIPGIAYYSWGVTKAWNTSTSTYQAYYSPRSPAQNNP